MKTLEFLILQVALPHRGERINIGIAVLWPDRVEFMFHPDAGKRLAGFHPDAARIDLAAWERDMQAMLGKLTSKEEKRLWLANAGAPISPGSTGEIYLEHCPDVEAELARILGDMAGMPKRTAPAKRAKPESRLNGEMKKWFRAAKLFSPHIEDIARSKIVSGYPVSIDDNLFAEFALKNGALHVIETLDFRGASKLTAGMFGQTATKAVLLDQARGLLGKDSRRLVVTSASDYGMVKHAIHLIGKYADDMIAMESDADRQRLADFIASALHLEAGIDAPPP